MKAKKWQWGVKKMRHHTLKNDHVMSKNEDVNHQN